MLDKVNTSGVNLSGAFLSRTLDRTDDSEARVADGVEPVEAFAANDAIVLAGDVPALLYSLIAVTCWKTLLSSNYQFN